MRPDVMLPFGEGWQQPTPGEVRELLSSQGWTGSQAAKIAGVATRTVRHWVAPIEQNGARPIPYAAWRLFLIEAGLT